MDKFIKYYFQINSSQLIISFLKGRHTKTGQLAAIKVMDVTEVCLFTSILVYFYNYCLG
jgi:hypothetical protein